MELILISSPVAIPDELPRLNDYFQLGLKRYHLRKPYYSLEKTEDFLSKVDPQYYPYIALHSHHSLCEKFGINRIHYPEDLRNHSSNEIMNEKAATNYILSTSVHSIDALAKLADTFSYAFLGPVFPSISKKGYGDPFNPDKWSKIKYSSMSAMAIGGVKCDNIKHLKELGFKGAAILGSIWSQTHDLALQEISNCINQCELTYHE